MIDKLEEIEKNFVELEKKLGDPELYSDLKLAASMQREYKDLSDIISTFRKYKRTEALMSEAYEMLSSEDAELRELARDEFNEKKENALELELLLKNMLIAKDPNDERNVIIEIRAGAGGEEAALFAATLYRMYGMYADSKGWTVELLHQNETELGGIKEVSFSIEGTSVYARLKFESGVHRVQRIPETESQGRIHTSTVTVAVLPEAKEIEVDINPADLEIDTFRSSGAGGQHVNKTESAIRIIHLPTGIVAECQDERSQHKNKDKAMKILRSRIYEMMLEKQNQEIAIERRSQVGTGDRSERIRTYNYPQSRVSDHRISLTIYKLDSFLNGDMDEVIDSLIADERAKILESGEPF